MNGQVAGTCGEQPDYLVRGLSFELKGGSEAASRFLDRLRLVVHAVSLGGLESLATRPAMSSHRGMPPQARARAGIVDGLIRLSVGVETPEDLLADLNQALAAE
jgi:cystathionine beta-lyase/cystathionine gamma-synthase